MQSKALRLAAVPIAILLWGIPNINAKPHKQHKPKPLITDLLPTYAATTTDMSARRKHRRYARHRHRRYADANGNVISHKTGAKAVVAADYAAKFQAYIDDIENNYGATVYFMGGYRRGSCHSGSLHPCGRALDVCQLSRGAVDSRCHLPGRVTLGAVALQHGLFEGGMWCDNDYGHVQAGVSATPCVNNILAAVKRFKLAVLPEVGTDPEAAVYGGERLANIEEKTKLSSFSERKRTRVARVHRYTRQASARRHYRHYRHYAKANRYAYSFFYQPVDRQTVH